MYTREESRQVHEQAQRQFGGRNFICVKLKWCRPQQSARIMDEKKDDAFIAAEAEWDTVQEIVPKFAQDHGDPATGDPGTEANEANFPREALLVTIEEVITDFRSQNLNLSNNDDFTPARPSWKQRLDSALECSNTLCCRPQGIGDSLENEKRFIYAISRQPFDDENPLHFRVLLTLYKQFTGSRLDCVRYGSHWEQIGFQGNDPATDLRGVGFMGLIQPLYLVMTPELLPLAKDIYKLSLSETQNFPLLVLSINLTRVSLHALRDGLLDKQIIREHSVWSALNYFYVAIMHHVYKVWKQQHKTIKDSGYVLKDTEAFCRKNVKTVIENLQNHLVNAYSVREKQIARENIKERTRQSSVCDALI